MDAFKALDTEQQCFSPTNSTSNDHGVGLRQELVSECSFSYADPVLKHDERQLSNLLLRCSNSHSFCDYFANVQTELKPHMRKIVSDWMLEVCEEQQCLPDVFSLAINYLDRFLSKVCLQKSQFQLLACVCIFVASKFKESQPISAQVLAAYTDNSVDVQEIVHWEMIVLELLGWDLSVVTSYSVLDALLASNSAWDTSMIRKHAETFVALADTEYAFNPCGPVLVGAAALGAAIRGLDVRDCNALIKNIAENTRLSEDKLLACMDEIEASIGRSMSGRSFQPNEQQQQRLQIVVNSVSSSTKTSLPTSGFLHNKVGSHHSTTPTELMEVSATCVF